MTTPGKPLELPDSHWIAHDHGNNLIVVRRDSAGEPEPEDWLPKLEFALRRIPGAMAVGAKRIGVDGKLFSMGEFAVHPKGLHALGRGLEPQAYRFPEEVDAIAGGVCLVDARAFQAARGPTLLSGELGGLQLGLSLRGAGGRCIALPDVTVVDSFFPKPAPLERSVFFRKWGFDCFAPDMDDLQDFYRASGVCWNPRFFGPGLPYEKYRIHGAMHWNDYDQNKAYRQRADEIARLVKKLCPPGRLLDFGCGDGLFAHLFAKAGLEVVGVDVDKLALDLATKNTARQRYSGVPPRFFDSDGINLPVKLQTIQMVTLLDVIEHLKNPARMLQEVSRVLVTGGYLFVVTPEWRFGNMQDYYHITEYTLDELKQLVEATGLFKTVWDTRVGGGARDIIARFRKIVA